MLKDFVVVVVLAGVLAAASVYGRWAATPVDANEHPYVSLYDPPRTSAEAMLNEGDGQAFAALAQDPTLSRPEVFNGSAAAVAPADEAAYRAGRPLFGWLAWIASLGQPERVPFALLGLTVVGAVMLAGGAALAAARLHRRVELALLCVMLPGSVILFAWTGPEAFAVGLGLTGLVLWPEHRWPAVLALTLAALTRESLLLIPLTVATFEAVHRRRFLPLLTPALALGLWDLIDRARFGAFPTAAGRARLAAPWSSWPAIGDWLPIDWAIGMLGVALVIGGFLRLPPLWKSVLAAYVGLALFMGPDVWKRWQDFSRPLLPLYVIGFIACIPAGEPVTPDQTVSPV